jgi:hypothetical protein
MRVDILTSLPLSEADLQTFLSPYEFDQLAAAINLGKQLLDKAEDNLLRAAFKEWTPSELEGWVDYGSPEPEATPELDRLREMFSGSCKPSGEPK